MPAATTPKPHAIVIDDWQGFCRLIDQDRADDSESGWRHQRAQREWRAIEPLPTPALPALLAKGRGFNILRYSSALVTWLTDWGILHTCHVLPARAPTNEDWLFSERSPAASQGRQTENHGTQAKGRSASDST